MCRCMDRARIYVDFNEMVESDLVLLSKIDVKADSNGNEVTLAEGLFVHIYMDDTDASDNKDNLLADGIVELNDPNKNGQWTSAAKWCCRIDSRGIYNQSST
jgi:hypothetical protein